MIKANIKKLIRRLGFDLIRYNPKSSINARILQFFKIYKIDTVLDVGANIGQYALWLRECGYKDRIISFEPLSKAHHQLIINSKKDFNWIITPRIAIGNEEGRKIINIAGNFVSSSILKMSDIHVKAAPKSAYIGSEEINIIRLDSIGEKYLIPDNNVFLKIDVQGYESQVLKGAINILPKIKGIQIEFSLVTLYEDQLPFHEMIE